MKLYRVFSYDYGNCGRAGPTIVGTGSYRKAFSNQTDALREYNRRRRELDDRGVRYAIRLDLLEAPTMTTELWIRAIEEGELPYTLVDRLRVDRRMEVAA